MEKMLSKVVDIGFVEKCESWKLHSRFFPSKVGGRPAWLNLKDLPKPDELKCGFCQEPFVYLCQIYAPVDDNAEAFHRTLFVFICKNGSCSKANTAENLVVFRCQLKRENPFYPFEPPEENEEAFDMSRWPPLCCVCGSKGPSHCGKCKSVNYCSRSHQVLDWKCGHKEACAEEQNVESKTKVLFPEWELVTEAETEEEIVKTSEEAEMNYLRKLIDEKKAGTLVDESEKELEQYANKDVEDKAFETFKARISRDPEQVLRYDRGGSPLWISSQNIVNADDVPDCPYCNGKREYECQIMPQLLNFLDLGVAVDSIDWGVIVLWTCKDSCSTDETPYKKEHITKQDIVQKTTAE